VYHANAYAKGLAATMKLTFQSPFLSIKEFPTVELPPFTLLTGLNGVGKTHLLRSIEKGTIQADVAPNRPGDVRYFDRIRSAPSRSVRQPARGRGMVCRLPSRAGAMAEVGG
jgi:predicted ATPase